MTTSYSELPPGVIVNQDDSPPKPPPVLTTGMLAWLRENLFKTTFDTLLTIISGGIAFALLSGLLTWAVSAANWFVITQNLEQLMTGTFPRDLVWRVNLAALLCAFVIGLTVYAYLRVARALVIVIVGAALLLVILPPIIFRMTAPASTYLAAGDAPIISGSQTETPQPALSFIGRAGEVITVELAAFDGRDERLSAAAGFSDRATSALINLASARLNAQARRSENERLLAGDLLTANQRAALVSELERLALPPAVTGTYSLNQHPVRVSLHSGASGASLAEMVLAAPADRLEAALPEDGWYVLRKRVDGEGAAVLRVTGIAPMLERSSTRAAPSGAVRVTQFVRISDRFELEAPRPTEDDGRDIPILRVNDAQYRGVRPFNDYLRLFAAPFLGQLSVFILPMLAVGAAGWAAGWGAGRLAQLSAAVRVDPRRPVQSLATWLWIAFFFLMMLLIYGANGLSALTLALILARFAWVGWMFYAGMNAHRSYGSGALAGVMALGVVQSILIENVTLGMFSQPPGTWLPRALSVLIWLGIGVFAARRGANARNAVRESAALRGLIGAGLVWLGIIIGIAAILSLAGASENLLPVTDTGRWGGFLLTLLLTVVAIVGSFPLGVLLALGRRSSLPAIRLTCVVFIELVRGVPLITVLFMAQLLVPLVNPALAEVDNVFRAMVGLTLFSAAYLAENVRGGLQSVAGGQEEAARALGLTGWQITLFITLPQALRAVIPALVGQCIALFKDTSLVALVGLLDLTGTSRSVIAQSEFVGLQNEIFLFTSILYFIFSYIMSAVSRRIEASGSGAARREL
jgi:His/Glu/Gln/Arg/opine family amino acid ABC transporter permease subunit